MLKESRSTDKILYWFLLIWTMFNLLQAGFTGLHADEAYYWLYSKHLDWGYFDHPPIVGLFIRAGDLISHSPFGLRLLTVISSTISVYVLWLILKKYQENIRLFALLFTSILIFHVYGFITTPDSPLLLFGVLFFYIYQRYLKEDKLKWALWLALIIAGLLYSKYHGVLILFFTFLSNYQLIKRPSFWVIIVISSLLFLPHVYWQIQNGYPSLNYHLFDRSAKPYKFEYTSDYLLGQLLIAGPLIGWFLYKTVITFRYSDIFIRAIRFNFYGIFIFFFLSTFKGRVEPHWTLLAFPSLLILSYLHLAKLKSIPRWVEKLAIGNIILILLVRLIFIIPLPRISQFRFLTSYYNSKPWAKEISAKAGDKYVILLGGFQQASLFDFYNNTTKGFAYDTRFYRKTQFDIWPLEDSLRNKTAYYVRVESHGKDINEDTISTQKGTFYGRSINGVRTYQKVLISTEPLTDNWKAGGLRSLNIKIYNPYAETISFSNKGELWKCFLEFGFMENGKVAQFNPVISKFAQVTIAPKSTVTIPAIVRAPSKRGKYKLVFSIRTEPFPGSLNSNKIAVNIN